MEKRRTDDEADPGLVMVPGGHVETGESFMKAHEGFETGNERGAWHYDLEAYACSDSLLHRIER